MIGHRFSREMRKICEKNRWRNALAQFGVPRVTVKFNRSACGS